MSEVAEALARAVDGTATRLNGIERTETVDGVDYARGGRPIAALRGPVLRVRLEPLIARAALRTPDVEDAGGGWISFAPAVADRYALDRATAWLESAWRHAG